MPLNQRILLVDDEEDILRSTTLWLSKAGYQTSKARNGVQAIEAINANRPTAVVMDVRMPKKDGLTALRELRQNPATKTLPIIMLSASLVDKEQALDWGATYFLTKPYHGKTLVETVAAAVEQNQNLVVASSVNPNGPV